jgi:hypothetical protein
MVAFPWQVVADHEKQQKNWQEGAQWQGWHQWQQSVAAPQWQEVAEGCGNSSESLFASANNMRTRAEMEAEWSRRTELEVEVEVEKARAVELEVEVERLTQERDGVAKCLADERTSHASVFSEFLTEHARTTTALELEQARVEELLNAVESAKPSSGQRAEMETESSKAQAVELEVEVERLTQERDGVAKCWADESRWSAFSEFLIKHELEQAKVKELLNEVESAKPSSEEIRQEIDGTSSSSTTQAKKQKADGDDDGWTQENLKVATDFITQDRAHANSVGSEFVPATYRMVPATLIYVSSGGQEFHLGCIKDVRQEAVCKFDVIVDCMGGRKVRDLHPKLEDSVVCVCGACGVFL